MAKRKVKISGVWGIDIGQCALKALRCIDAGDGETIVADAFDYIEYPKILSQPDANAEELVREAIEQFLSRNDIKGDKIAISVSGQAGLSRFFKPPPVEAKVIPDIVRYEARQQIPFALEDVIWDYQRIGGTEVDGFVMDAEVGIFAMKRDAVFRALQPFLDAEVEVDIVQLAPLAVFNVILHDLMNGGPDPEEVDENEPPESLVVLSMGTETTDLVITNGLRLWQRNIPLGGNHFTKQLTKELKLTYAKAEHLKRNARQAEDPKTVFQVMRPVFNDLVTEVQRSIGYFQSIDRQARIGKMVMLGNAVKLPGLRQYLSKNLGQEVVRLDSYTKLAGASVIEAKAFKDNLYSFAVCYGLCLQGLDIGKLDINLLPQEFLTERMIRDKKPWVVAAVAALLLAVSFNYFFHFQAWHKVHPERTYDGVTWTSAIQQVDTVDSKSNELLQRDKQQLAELAHITSLGEEVVGDADRKILWLELLRAINQALPHSDKYEPGTILDPAKVPFVDRPELQIEYLESEYFEDLSTWFTSEVARRYQQDVLHTNQPSEEEAGEGTQEGSGTTSTAAQAAQPLHVPEGPGWVIQLGGYHYHNSDPKIPLGIGGAYVRNTLLKTLREGTVKLPGPPKPDGQPGDLIEFSYRELGIQYPILALESKIDYTHTVPNPNHPANQKGSGGGRPGTKDADQYDTDEPLEFPAPRYDFVVQFCWQEKPLSQRLKARAEQAQAAQLAEQTGQQQEGEAAGEGPADEAAGEEDNGGN